jgi:PhnB protein
VTPWIVSRDTARLMDYLKAAFDGKELARVMNPDGTIGHAEMRIGDSIVMLFDAGKNWPPTPSFLRLYVEDADAVHARALEAGGTSVTEVTELFFGDRVGRIRDPADNIWWIQAHVADLSPEEMGRRAGEPRFVDAMREVQDSLERELSRRDRKAPP